MNQLDIYQRPLEHPEIDLLIKDIQFYPDLVYIKKSRLQNLKNPYVIETTQNFVGICGIYETKNWIKLGPLVFLKKYHGKGYGKILLDEITKNHKDKNLFITSTNLAVQKIVKKLGYLEVESPLKLPKEIKKFLVVQFYEHLHWKMITEFFRKLLMMDRNKRKYYIKLS